MTILYNNEGEVKEQNIYLVNILAIQIDLNNFTSIFAKIMGH